MLKKVAPFLLGTSSIAMFAYYNTQRNIVFNPHKQVYDEIKENGNKYKFTTKFTGNKDIISKNSLASVYDKHLFRYITNASRHIAYNGYKFDLSNIQAYIDYLNNMKHGITAQQGTPQNKLRLMDIAIAIDYIAKYIADL